MLFFVMNNYKLALVELSRIINVEFHSIAYILYNIGTENSYKTFEIPKKNGEFRVINTPVEKLKYIQRQLKKELYEKTKNEKKLSVSYGFEKDKNIIKNASRHKNKKYILNMDISDFFDSFNFGRVQGYFYKNKNFKYSKEISTIIAQLVCYKGKLPQGAPTSPIIANLIFNIVDLKILKLIKKYKLYYTRYADDMTFSTNDRKFEKNYTNFIKDLTNLVEKSGFSINSRKTRLIYSSSRQEVTGLTVNRKVNVNREFIYNTRAMANKLYTYSTFEIDSKPGTLNQLEGRFSFINQIDKFNCKNEKVNGRYKDKLNFREKQYRYFLFYKYFYKPIKPTIVTEGKTDIIHMKAALMNNYNKYPELITKVKGGYKFKICFLNKSKQLKEFFGIEKDGADTMKNIYNFYKGCDGCENIYNYIDKKNKVKLKVNPVILLFDNEQTKGKPLKKILDHTNIKELKENRVKLTNNLYLQTIPLVGGKKECEIEDLYFKEDLVYKINGKNYDYSDQNIKQKYYFSLYVIRNYNKINFKNFLPILDSIKKIINEI